ncbi:hypothetical protein NQ318_016595 [Aromia moschata]|uniref:Transposase n=1 Tax=Aromia moschata TaxID=1265417 RepID=A0AAV8XX08_9CUCU|nr:hypothetical protein NQ318_016595 [Aromia moschata]
MARCDGPPPGSAGFTYDMTIGLLAVFLSVKITMDILYAEDLYIRKMLLLELHMRTKTRCRKNATDDEHSVGVLGSVFNDPHISIERQIESECDISRSSIQRILKSAKIRPFNIHLHQGLEPGDYERRIMAFLAWLATAHEDGNIISILWTDESRFHNNGTINRHNCHYWSEDNPHWMRETNFQRIWKINVWCGMIDGATIRRNSNNMSTA